MGTSVIGASRRRRRSHSDEFKAMVVQACLRPGVSIASVALANALNANMLRKWVIDAERAQAVAAAPKSIARNNALTKETPTSTPNFIPLPLTVSPPPPDIHIELQRSGTTVKVRWPTSAADQCGAWLRELLR